MNAGVLTVSGVHGVGKSAVSEFLQRRFTLPVEPKRPSNPFSDPYHSMLFFIASFSARDFKAREIHSQMALDRYSFHDIAVYVEVLHRLGKITHADYERLRSINIAALLGSLEPEVAVLLHDDVESVLMRLSKRGGKIGHIFEHDRQVIYHLNEAFIREFTNWEITRAWVNQTETTYPTVLRISVRNRSVSEVGGELVSRLQEIGLPANWPNAERQNLEGGNFVSSNQPSSKADRP